MLRQLLEHIFTDVMLHDCPQEGQRSGPDHHPWSWDVHSAAKGHWHSVEFYCAWTQLIQLKDALLVHSDTMRHNQPISFTDHHPPSEHNIRPTEPKKDVFSHFRKTASIIKVFFLNIILQLLNGEEEMWLAISQPSPQGDRHTGLLSQTPPKHYTKAAAWEKIICILQAGFK